MGVVISIVIANYNYGRFLESAIKSVLDQDGFDSCELIVVDGGSTDNSVDVIRRYSDKISWWCSEKDRGQSDAFNKGFSHAHGELGCWLNADDVLLPGTLRSVVEFSFAHPRVEWISGGMAFCDADLHVRDMRIGCSVWSKAHDWLSMTVIGGPSSFFSLKRLREVGGFDVSLHYIMDGDLWKRFFRAGVRLHHLNRYFWGFRLHEQSKTSSAVTRHVMSAGQKSECERLTRRDAIPRYKRELGAVLLKCWKVLSGSILRSKIDTYKYRGRLVTEIN